MKNLINACLRLFVKVFGRYPRRRPQPFSEANLLVDAFASQRKLDGLMLDVGAQFGESLGPYRRLGWEVYAFEPDPNPSKQRALALLEGKKIHLSRLAVSDTDGLEVPIYASPESTGVTSLAPFLESHVQSGTIKTITLAKFIGDHAITHVDFLKIDTEGFDFHVLRGYPWQREECHPGVILCEFEDRKSLPLGYRWSEMADYLQSKGYRVWVSEWYPIKAYGTAHDFRRIMRYPAGLAEAGSWGNLIAVKSSSSAHIIEEKLERLAQRAVA